MKHFYSCRIFEFQQECRRTSPKTLRDIDAANEKTPSTGTKKTAVGNTGSGDSQATPTSRYSSSPETPQGEMENDNVALMESQWISRFHESLHEDVWFEGPNPTRKKKRDAIGSTEENKQITIKYVTFRRTLKIMIYSIFVHIFEMCSDVLEYFEQQNSFIHFLRNRASFN